MKLIPLEVLKKAKTHPDLGFGICVVLKRLGYRANMFGGEYREHLCQFHPNKEWYWWTKGDKHSRAAYLQKLIDNHPDSVTKPVAEH